MLKRQDFPEAAALIGALLLSAGVLLWQVLPHVAPGWFDRDEQGDTAALSRPDDAEKLPWNPDLRRGQLDNGLTYMVLPHQKPEQRAYLWLVVKAGAVQEDDDLRGLAHFVEHMAFNGTEKYEKQAIIEYLEKDLGMRFGPEINAETAFDRTVYKLKVPTDDPAAIAKGLDFLHQWAAHIEFDRQEVVAERGVVLEEWRMGRGAGMRMAEKLIPAILKGSKYPERLPIGTPESIETATPERLRRYYDTWYRPDLMAVIAVGDFEAGAVEEQIRQRFGDLQAPPSPRPRKTTEIPAHGQPRAAVIQDDEANQPIALVIDKLPHEPTVTYGDLRDGLRGLVGLLTVSQRLGEIAQSPDAPFNMAAATIDTTQMIEALDMLQSVAMPKNESVDQAVETLLVELERAERHGFHEAEIDRTRDQIGALLTMAANSYQHKDGEEHMPELVDAFMRGSTFVGPKMYEQMVAELQAITPEEVHRTYADNIEKASRVVTLLGSTKLEMPSKERLLELLADVDERDIPPWKGGEEARPLLSSAPSPGTITQTIERPEIGVTEWKLSNGATVVVKQTDFKDDEILMQAAAPGGLSLIPDADFVTARYAVPIADESGAGDLDKIELRDSLAGKIASVSPALASEAAYVYGQTRPDDLETFLQLLHLRMRGARKDPEAYARWRVREADAVENRNALPETQAYNAFLSRFTQNHPRTRPVTRTRVEGVSHEQALQIYDRFFTDAGDFTFVFVGDVDPKTLEPLVKTYIGSLKGSAAREEPRDTGVRPVAGVQRMREQAGREPKTSALSVYHGEGEWSFQNRLAQRLVTEVLRLRLREVLREDESGTYAPQVFGEWSETNDTRSIRVRFTAEPERADALAQVLQSEVARVRRGQIDGALLDKVRETWKREHEEAVKTNAFWQRVLSRTYRRGSSIEPWLNLDGKLAVVTLDALRQAAAAHLPAGDRFDFFIDPDPEAVAKAKADGDTRPVEAESAAPAGPGGELEARDDAEGVANRDRSGGGTPPDPGRPTAPAPRPEVPANPARPRGPQDAPPPGNVKPSAGRDIPAEGRPDPATRPTTKPKKPEEKEPEAKKPEAKKPEAKKPEAKKPEAESAEPTPADEPGPSN